MYQSIPKRVYTTKESAMPKMPISKSFSVEHQDCCPEKSKPPLSFLIIMHIILYNNSGVKYNGENILSFFV